MMKSVTTLTLTILVLLIHSLNYELFSDFLSLSFVILNTMGDFTWN